MNIENQLHLVDEIDSEAETETLDTYEERIHYYQKHRYTYIPMPSDGKYYNTEEGWVKNINPSQFVREDTHLMDSLRKLQNHPFLLVDYMARNQKYLPKSKVLDAGIPETEIEVSNNVSLDDSDDDAVRLEFSQLEVYFPDIAEDMIDEFEGAYEKGSNETSLSRYGIITLADINRRPVKDMLYKVFSELTSQLSERIEAKYPDSEPILHHLRPVTIGRWKKDQLEGLDLHIAEHMNLIEIKQVIQSSDKKFVGSCGFSSKGDVDMLNSINELRNRVMHANRSLVYNRRDIQEILDGVNDAQSIIRNIE